MSHPTRSSRGRELVAIALLVAGYALAGSGPGIGRAEADLSHVQIHPHTGTMMVGYQLTAVTDEMAQFMATHYDVVIGGPDLSRYANAPVQLLPLTYYAIVVDLEDPDSEYQDARKWAAANGVDFESFFVHYAEPTRAGLGGVYYDLEAGSRVPTKGWFASNGDLAAQSAMVILNPGSSDYRAWRLNYIERQFASQPYFDGVTVSKTNFNQMHPAGHAPDIQSGGTYAEYPVDPETSYGDDMLVLFREFKERFGSAKVQVPNVGPYHDTLEGSRVNEAYPYIWAVERGDATLINPRKTRSVDPAIQDIASAEAAGLRNLIRGEALFGPVEEQAMAYLSLYYLLKSDSTAIFPLLSCIFDGVSIDPEVNQWFGAVAYDVGQPLGSRTVLARGIDPSSPEKDTMTATVTRSANVYRLTDPSKNWVENEWLNQYVAFPSGYVMKAYRNGADWLDLYAPEEVPTDGVYSIGKYIYEVLTREYDRALVVFRPRTSNPEIGDSSAAGVQLPATDDNPSGVYYMLLRDGTVDMTPRTSLSLRNTDGAVLVKASKTAGSLALQMTADKDHAAPGDTVTYTIRWHSTLDTTISGAAIADLIPAGTRYVPGSAEATGGSCDGTKVVWILGDLPPATSGSVSFQVTVE